MTQNELDLLHGYLHGSISPDGFARLQTLLRQSALARRTLRGLSTVDARLQELGSLHTRTAELLVMPPPAAAPAHSRSRWLAWTSMAAAACLTLFLGVKVLNRSQPQKTQPNLAASIRSTEHAIARLSYEPAATLPTWMSPTASMLEPPHLPQ